MIPAILVYCSTISAPFIIFKLTFIKNVSIIGPAQAFHFAGSLIYLSVYFKVIGFLCFAKDQIFIKCDWVSFSRIFHDVDDINRPELVPFRQRIRLHRCRLLTEVLQQFFWQFGNQPLLFKLLIWNTPVFKFPCKV